MTQTPQTGASVNRGASRGGGTTRGPEGEAPLWRGEAAGTEAAGPRGAWEGIADSEMAASGGGDSAGRDRDSKLNVRTGMHLV